MTASAFAALAVVVCAKNVDGAYPREMNSPDVLVVGAGPVGLSLACELVRHGLACRVIDELAEPVVWSKAAVVHTRTMEIFDDMGVSEALLALSRTVHGASVYADRRRVGHVVFEGVESRFPFAYGVSQRDTEAVLTKKLEAHGVRIERTTRLEGFVHEEDGVTANVVGPQGEARIEAKWIVGCDGAHSVVRKACGFTFEGAPYEERIVQADVRIDWPARSDEDEIQAFLHPDGPLAMFPLFKDGRYRLIAFLPPDAPEVELTLDAFQRFLDERGPAGARASDPAWMVAFRIHHRMTNRYRDRRAFVAGDAAHIHSPAGGQGMNTGIQDAYNLAWKLALVERGVAREAILDSYEAERMPIAKALLAATDAATRGMGTVTGLRHPITVALRNQLMSFVTKLDAFRERLFRSISMIDIAYRESPIVAQDRTPLFQANVVSSGATEQPSLADWAAFGEGPAPGDRAADVAMSSPEGARFYDLLRGTKHVALLFDGAAATEEGYRNLERIGRDLVERYGAAIDVHVIVPLPTKPAALHWDGSIVFDADGAIHKRYGARSECLYLIRPDGYVGYRCQPANGDALAAYLKTIFR
jgi:2-polyprenyl-6-methoxyphenol hydroxylase-like FAD-dependent oxidoreductase